MTFEEMNAAKAGGNGNDAPIPSVGPPTLTTIPFKREVRSALAVPFRGGVLFRFLSG